MKVVRVLLATLVGWTLVQLCASNTRGCLEATPSGSVQVEISCTVFPNGTLSTSWSTTGMYVDTVRIDYNCSVSGEEQIANLYNWVSADSRSRDTVTNILPVVSGTQPMPSLTIEPTCYVDGCYEWTPPRVTDPTIMIPRVTCSKPSQSSNHASTPHPLTSGPTQSSRYTTTLHPVTSGPTQSSRHTSSVQPVISTPSQSSTYTSTPTEVTSSVTTSIPGDSGGLGLQVYIVPVVIIVTVLIVLCFVLSVSIMILNKRRRRWWRYDSKDLLVGNEPSIDPYNRVKNEYYDTMTIVDPLEHGSVTRMEDTNVAYGGTPFLYNLHQQAGDVGDQSSSESGSNSESSNTPMESGRNKGDEIDSSACVQIVESTNVERQQSDSGKEKLRASNTASTKPAAKLTSPQARNTSTAAAGVSPYPNGTSPPHTRPKLGGLATLHQNKTIDASIICQRNTCNSNNSSSPDYVPSSEYTASSGNGTSSVVSSSDIEEVETGDIMMEEDTGPTNQDDGLNASSQSMCINSDLDNGQGLAHQTPEDNSNSSAASDDTPLLLTSKRGGAADRSALKLPLLGGSGMSASNSRDHQADGAKAFGHQQRFQDHYVSSSEYTSSECSNRQSRPGNSIVGYLADIEDVEISSLQSDLESDNDTHDRACLKSHDCEDKRRNVDEHNYDAGDIVELNISLSNKLPQRAVTRHRRCIASSEDDDGLYYAMHDRVSLPESPCSGYIDMGLLSMPRNQEEAIYEDMSRQNEHAPIEDHDYVEVGNLPQNRQYRYETTV